MEPTTYKLDRQGYISHQIEDTTNYLCGISVAYKDCWVYNIYWTSDQKHALNVFDLCKVWNKVTTTTAMEYENAPVETLVGTTSSYVTHELPYKLSAGDKTVYLGTYQVSTERWAHEELTPEWLHAATKPTAPILKIQNIYDYAFLVGTLCSMGTEPPNWEPLMPVLAARADACVPTSEGGIKAVIEIMDVYFKVGTLCKPGALVSDFTDLPVDCHSDRYTAKIQ